MAVVRWDTGTKGEQDSYIQVGPCSDETRYVFRPHANSPVQLQCRIDNLVRTRYLALQSRVYNLLV